MGINDAFEIPDRRVPSLRAQRNRRSPTHPNVESSIRSGRDSAIDFTGVVVNPATLGIAREPSLTADTPAERVAILREL
jgi:hypothetical protein